MYFSLVGEQSQEDALLSLVLFKTTTVFIPLPPGDDLNLLSMRDYKGSSVSTQ